MRRHLILFVREPRYGAGKRRLAAEIGDAAALRFQHRMLGLAIRRLRPGKRWILRLAVTPDRARVRRRLWPADVPVMPQGGGDLGERMHRAISGCPSGPVVLVGNDIPGVTRAHIAQAFRLLGNNDLVFGPARDGGFWLVGARRIPAVPPLFGAVRWSSPDALGDVLRNVPAAVSVGFAATLDDVDNAASFRALAPARGF